MKWKLLYSSKLSASNPKRIINILLANRGLKDKREKDEFLNPEYPFKISLKEVAIKKSQVDKAKARIKMAKERREKVIVFGDYDADGITATAILWENLYRLGVDVLPFIPDRFSEGYGLREETVDLLVDAHNDLKLIITVDNGIVAHNAIKYALNRGIDTIVTDHHQKNTKKLAAHSVIHTTKICGSAIAWFLSRELCNNPTGLELAAIGTIADMLPLTGVNRSIAKYGLVELNKATRPGLVSMIKEAGIKRGTVGTYQVNFLIAPRINSTGRIGNALDSLRLLCTKDVVRSEKLAQKIGKLNIERQNIVDEVLAMAQEKLPEENNSGIILLAHENYHEGVIGLAASKLVEKYYRPSIVISMGEKVSKASARSIDGVNIIEEIRKLEGLIIEGGGHPMAAGFSIYNEKIEEFKQELDKLISPQLTEEVLEKSLKVDMAIDFSQISSDLLEKIISLEPYGLGNPTPLFCSEVTVLDARTVGGEKHLKLIVAQNGVKYDAIAFGFGEYISEIEQGSLLNIAFSLEENVWNGKRNIQLKIRDIK